MKTMEPHELALDYPAVEDLDEFNEDIKIKGVLNPTIYVYEGKILDGWHRYQAAVKAGKEPKLTPYAGDDPEGFVDSMNGKRRHLRKEQIAVIMALRAKRQGRLVTLPSGLNAAYVEGRDRRDPITSATVRDRASVGASTARHAVRLADERPARAEAVKDGRASLEEEYAKLNVQKEFAKADTKRTNAKAEEREVKAYLDAVKTFQAAVSAAIDAKRRAKFSPEALRFVARKHDALRASIERLEK